MTTQPAHKTTPSQCPDCGSRKSRVIRRYTHTTGERITDHVCACGATWSTKGGTL